MPPWPKGTSGNPGGRPRAATLLAKQVREETDGGKEILRLVLEIARSGPDGKWSERSVTWALQWLSDRAYGRPVETIEIAPEQSANDGGSWGWDVSVLKRLSLEQLHRVERGEDLDQIVLEAVSDADRFRLFVPKESVNVLPCGNELADPGESEDLNGKSLAELEAIVYEDAAEDAP